MSLVVYRWLVDRGAPKLPEGYFYRISEESDQFSGPQTWIAVVYNDPVWYNKSRRTEICRRQVTGLATADRPRDDSRPFLGMTEEQILKRLAYLANSMWTAHEEYKKAELDQMRIDKIVDKLKGDHP